jgi:hypothetical protein
MSDPLAQMCLDLARAHQALADVYAFHAKALASPGFRPQPPLAPAAEPPPAYAPPPPAARPAGAATGVTLAFGNAKGMDASMAPTADLVTYAKALEKSVADPAKAQWAQRNSQQLAVIRGELARRGPNG